MAQYKILPLLQPLIYEVAILGNLPSNAAHLIK